MEPSRRSRHPLSISLVTLASVFRYLFGVFVEQSERFVARLRGQQEVELAEAKFFRGVPVVGSRRRAEHQERNIVAGALTQLTDAVGQPLDWERVGDPARIVADHPLDGGVRVAAD